MCLFFPLWMALKLMEVTPTHIREEMHGKEYFCKLSGSLIWQRLGF